MVSDRIWWLGYFTHMEVVFVVGLPLSLAKAPGHAALALMGYLMFNTFINAILTQWPYVWRKFRKRR